MGIPEQQLERWTTLGAQDGSRDTYASIKYALSSSSSVIKTGDYDIYLQGSYPNSTNIRGDSDVDVVLQLNATMFSDTSSLTVLEKQLYEGAVSPASYYWADFRQDVLCSLKNYYGTNQISDGKKSIKIKANTNRLAADVVPCIQFRKYKKFLGPHDEEFVEGITFWSNEYPFQQIINYPKVHIDNGAAKNKRANQYYKRTVRMFKNARNALIDKGWITSKTAPSYFLECLIYNAADSHFSTSLESTFIDVLSDLANGELN